MTQARSPVGATNGTYYYNSNSSRKTGSSSLGRDDFLRILVTQLANQDPTQPLQDKEFIAQMAQFTIVEQITNMAEEMRLLRQSIGWGATLIGKSIEWETVDESGQKIIKSGIVDAIHVKDGKQYARVGYDNVPLDKIVKIAEADGANDD